MTARARAAHRALHVPCRAAFDLQLNTRDRTHVFVHITVRSTIIQK